MRDKLIEGGYIWMFVFAILITILAGAFSKVKAQSPEEVYNHIQRIGIKHPDIVFKQCLLETGHLTSDIYKENKNLFGMKEAKVRETTARGTNRNHALYPSWRSSVMDYKLYQDRYYKGGDYYDFLESHGYATNPVYVEKLKSMEL